MVANSPIPVDEKERLEALNSHCILDTPPDERFDLFARMSTWLYDVPLAAINFVDSNRTFFKSLIGMPRYAPERLTSICAHTIASDHDIMVVPDLANDRRFEDHPFVARGIHFYAGAVLRPGSGHAIGTLCISDFKARAFSQADQDRLKQLAKGVSSVLELHRSELELLEAVRRDALTGLWNRRFMMQRLDQILPATNLLQPSTVLYLDLDRFKAVNDRFGHSGGDAMLCEVAERLVKVVQGNDVVVRIAGDEFAILLCPGSPITYAEIIAARVLEAFAKPFAIEKVRVPIRSSIGIASSPLHARDPASLVHCADLALYEAKQSGRNCWRTFGSYDTTMPMVKRRTKY